VLDQSGNDMYAATEYVGYNGSGQYLHSGGSNTASTYLFLGHLSNGVGTYVLSGSGVLNVSDSGCCASAMTEPPCSSKRAASTTSERPMRLLRSAPTPPATGLSSERRHAQRHGPGAIGLYGMGAFDHTNELTISALSRRRYLYLGGQVGGSGSYRLNGGTLNAQGFEFIGNSGTGVFDSREESTMSAQSRLLATFTSVPALARERICSATAR